MKERANGVLPKAGELDDEVEAAEQEASRLERKRPPDLRVRHC